MKPLYILFAGLVILLLWAFDAFPEGEIRIAPTVEVSWDMTTNHVYTLWVSDSLSEPFSPHPAYNQYTPASNRTGRLWRGVGQTQGFFKLEVDGLMFPTFPSTNAIVYNITVTTNAPPMPKE